MLTSEPDERSGDEIPRARGGVRLLVDRQDLDGDVAGGLLLARVDGLIGEVDGLGLGARLEAHRVLRDERLAVLRVDAAAR